MQLFSRNRMQWWYFGAGTYASLFRRQMEILNELSSNNVDYSSVSLCVYEYLMKRSSAIESCAHQPSCKQNKSVFFVGWKKKIEWIVVVKCDWSNTAHTFMNMKLRRRKKNVLLLLLFRSNRVRLSNVVSDFATDELNWSRAHFNRNRFARRSLCVCVCGRIENVVA